MEYYGGRTNYGQSIGILMLDTTFPRIPGDIGNATTFPYPVLYKTVTGATPKRVVEEADVTLIQPFIDAGMELVRQGARAIVTSCGFMAIYQKEMAAALPVPVYTSSLLQLPLVAAMLKPDQCVGIMTANSDSLGERHFLGVGAEKIRKVVYGIQDTYAGDIFLKNGAAIDPEKAEASMVEVALRMVKEHPEVGAIVFECTNMPPFAAAVQRATGVPVFDIVTLTDYVHSALCRSPYHGYM